MTLHQISETIMIDFKKVEAVKRMSEEETLLIINGVEYPSRIPFHVLLDTIKKAKMGPIETTNPAQFAG